MLVEELKRLLKDVPDHYLVVLSKDAEGNRFSPMSKIVRAEYVEDNSFSGEVWAKCDRDEEGEEYKENVAVLFPVN